MPLRHCERSEAIQYCATKRKNGLLRRCAPLRKRFAFVAGNDGVTLSVIASAAKQSMPRERMDCFVAALPCANASRLSQAMTEERALRASLHERHQPFSKLQTQQPQAERRLQRVRRNR